MNEKLNIDCKSLSCYQNRQPDSFLHRFLNELHPKNKNEEEYKME